jgi:biotin-(acetyl-CoA carboxylase) ligase
VTDIPVDVLDTCASTQSAAAARLEAGADLVAVAARHQVDGRGREGRLWQEPPAPGEALLLSVALRGPFPTSVLEGLPRHVGSAVRRALCAAAPIPVERLGWKEPNDLIDEASGAKVGGILIDAQTVGDEVTQVVIGIGANLSGAPFRTSDGRQATTLTAMSWGTPLLDVAELRERVAADVAKVVLAGGGSYASRATVAE